MSEYTHYLQRKKATGARQQATGIQQGLSLEDNRISSITQQKRMEALQLKSKTDLNNAVQPYQLQATIGFKAYNRESLYQLVGKRLEACGNPILIEVVRYSLIPSLVDGHVSYQSMELFNDQFDHYLKTMKQYILGFFSLSLPELIAAQEKFQNEIAFTNPMLMTTLTTNGFEFEFLQMTDDSPLKGFSHLELAKTMAFGHTALPFKIETDSSSEIELVTPPFLIPTLGTGSLPHHSILKQVSKLFHEALVPLQAQAHQLSSQEELPKGLQGLIALLNRTLGIVLHLNPGKIKTHNLSYNANPERAKALLGEKPNGELLGTIKFKDKNEKYSEDKPIASQLNFAASAETLGLLLSQETLKEDAVGVFSPLYAFWHKYLLEKAPGLPFDYLEHMVQKLASIYAVPLQRMVLQELAVLKTIVKEDKQLPEEIQQQMFASIANLISFVKDIKHIWVKDDLISITRAYLKNPKVCEKIKTLNIDDLPGQISGIIDHNLLKWGLGKQLPVINQEYIKDCVNAIKTLKTVCGGTHPEKHIGGVDFLEHNPEYIGGRQDTYIALNAIKKAKGSNRRYLGEIRDGGLERLTEMGNKIITTEHAKYANDDEVVELNEQLLKEHSEELYQAAYKLYLPEKEKPDEEADEDPMSDLLGQDILLDDVDSTHKSKKKKDKKHRKKEKKKKKDKKKTQGNPRAESIKKLVIETSGTAALGDIPGRLVGLLNSMGADEHEIEQFMTRGSQAGSLEELLRIVDEVFV